MSQRTVFSHFSLFSAITYKQGTVEKQIQQNDVD